MDKDSALTIDEAEAFLMERLPHCHFSRNDYGYVLQVANHEKKIAAEFYRAHGIGEPDEDGVYPKYEYDPAPTMRDLEKVVERLR